VPPANRAMPGLFAADMNVAVIRIATMTLAAMVVISKMLLGVSDLGRPMQDV
jgi:hypothetical protein